MILNDLMTPSTPHKRVHYNKIKIYFTTVFCIRPGSIVRLFLLHIEGKKDIQSEELPISGRAGKPSEKKGIDCKGKKDMWKARATVL